MAGSACEPTEQVFRVEIQQRESCNLLVLAGQIGWEAAAPLRAEAQLLAAGGREVAIDWREAESVTAGALQVLLALGLALSQRGQRLRVIEDNPNIRRLLEVAGLAAHLPLMEAVL